MIARTVKASTKADKIADMKQNIKAKSTLDLTFTNSLVKNKHYAELFLQNSMTQSIYAYGIAFAGKNCFISVMKIK